MNPSKYELKKNFKVQFLNFFRKAFRVPFFERLLLQQVLHSDRGFWKKLIPSHYLYSKPALRHIERDGLKFALDISNMNDHSVYFNYELDHFKSALKHLRPHSTVLDIGSNIGFSVLFFARNQKDVSVVGFEPHPLTYRKAVQNLSLNPSLDVKLENLALGSSLGSISIYEVNQSNLGMNRILLNDDEKTKFNAVNVPLTSLDLYLSINKVSKPISLVKIDVEGFEHEVLKGASNLLSSHRPTLLIELDDRNLSECNSSAFNLIKFLKAFGYSIQRVDDELEVDEHFDFTNCHFDIICTAKDAVNLRK